MRKWTAKATQRTVVVGLALVTVAGLVWFSVPSLLSARERLPSVSGERIAELARVCAWPTVVLIGLVIFRRQLRTIADVFANRASKVSILNLEIELAQSAQLTGWPTPAIQGIKEADGAVVAQDSAASLFQELHGTPADFAVVNLGHGQEWLTSRIYILSTLLRRMRLLRAIVFLTDSQAHERLFLGVTLPDHLRTRLDYYYPWLGECLQSQYKHHPRPPMGPPPEELTVYEAQRILGFYIEDLRKKSEDDVEGEWVELREGVWEHAKWVDGPLLARILGSQLERCAIEWKPTLDRADVRDVLGKQGSFVALVDGDGVFRDTLIDRSFMVESVARGLASHV